MIQASNEFLPNMKVEDLVLPFSKSPRTLKSHVWFARYDQFNFKNLWTSKGHISWTIWPILVGFFPTSSICSPLSKNAFIFHQNLTMQNAIFGLDFIKFQVWKKLTFGIKHFQHIWPFGTCFNWYLKLVQGPNSARTYTSMCICWKLANLQMASFK